MPNDTYIGSTTRNHELYHHGIKGQKWGVQNGPPYPLDSSKSTGSKLKDTGDDDQQETAKYTNVVKNKNGEYVPVAKAMSEPGWPMTSKGFSNEKMKTVNPAYKKIKAASFALTNLSAGSTMTTMAAFAVSPVIGLPSAIGTGALLAAKNTISEKEYDVTNNCARCSTVMALKMMGYDNIEAARTTTGATQKVQYMAWKNAKIYGSSVFTEGLVSKKDSLSSEEAYSKILEMKPGSFGQMSIKWQQGGGHSINWEKTENGYRLIDSQKSEAKEFSKDMNFSDAISSMYKGAAIRETGGAIIDLTNASPNFDTLGKYDFVAVPDYKFMYQRRSTGEIVKATHEAKLAKIEGKREKSEAKSKAKAERIEQSKVNRMKSMQSQGKTQEEIAESLGVSVSTVQKYLE